MKPVDQYKLFMDLWVKQYDNVTERDKLFADLWVKQYDIFLRVLALIPIAELAILAGWYALMKDGQMRLAQGAAILGAIVMFATWATLQRTTRYIRYFRSKLARMLEGVPSAPVTGRWIGSLLPLLCVVVNLILASGQIEIMAAPRSPPTPSSPAPK